ncbi:MAG: hypothetical protein KDE45_14610, partial [Caldilineaceae bacterium]|nr:hypothetical protein [Caldilineaceae bacterium]
MFVFVWAARIITQDGSVVPHNEVPLTKESSTMQSTMRKRTAVFLSLALIVALLLSACGGAAAPAP